MSIIFIAVQCCQCSTMQVKQRKKSSNKWKCVVCNQKQSVLKVFAQAFMAKDVRKFVQSFNMSRQLAEQSLSLVGGDDEQTLVSADEEISVDRKQKRTDWTEFLDPEEDEDDDDVKKSGDILEPKIVTELPKAAFKKPKLNDLGNKRKSNERAYRPVFGKRNSSYKQLKSLGKDQIEPVGPTLNLKENNNYREQSVETSADKGLIINRPSKDKVEPPYAVDIVAEKELMRRQTSNDKGASKWRDYISQEDSDNRLADKAPWKLGNGVTSKWDGYITEEDDGDNDLKFQSAKGLENHLMDQWHHVAFRTSNDQTIEDDIHPDFQ